MGVWRRGRMRAVRVSVMAVSVLLCLAIVPLGAQASSITFGGPTSFSVGYNLLTPLGAPLTATGTYNVTSFSATEVLLGITINNTTPNYVVSAIGFNTNPAVTASYTTVGSKFDGIGNNVNFPSFHTIEVCAFTSNNCSSSANGQALQANSSDSFALKLTGAFDQSLTLSTFAIKFAGGPEGSFEGAGKVPVPGTLLLFGVGFVVFAGWHYRSRLGLSA